MLRRILGIRATLPPRRGRSPSPVVERSEHHRFTFQQVPVSRRDSSRPDRANDTQGCNPFGIGWRWEPVSGGFRCARPPAMGWNPFGINRAGNLRRMATTLLPKSRKTSEVFVTVVWPLAARSLRALGRRSRGSLCPRLVCECPFRAEDRTTRPTIPETESQSASRALRWGRRTFIPGDSSGDPH